MGRKTFVTSVPLQNFWAPSPRPFVSPRTLTGKASYSCGAPTLWSLASLNPVDIFISHSSADAKVAKALIDLLRDAFNIEPARIRCTSVPGYKLEAGAHTETQLRQEIQQSRVFIGLLSEISLDSAYVLFELGARWGMMQSNYYGGMGMSGMKNKIFPLLAAGASGSIIRGPLKAYNALSCEKAADLHQLVAEIGKELGQSPGSAAAYQDKLETVIRTSRLLKGQRTKAANAKTAKTTPAPEKKAPAKRTTTAKPKK